MSDNNNNDKRWQVAFVLSTVDQTLEFCGHLLAKAKEDQTEKYLAGLVSVMAASALAQFVDQQLALLAEVAAVDLQIRIDATPPGIVLSSGSLRERVMELPIHASDGEIRLDENTKTAGEIFDLIALRNRLMHIKEGPILEWVTIEESNAETPHVHIRLNSRSFPKNPWTRVALSRAQGHRAAVEAYVRTLTSLGSHPSGISSPFVWARKGG